MLRLELNFIGFEWSLFRLIAQREVSLLLGLKYL